MIGALPDIVGEIFGRRPYQKDYKVYNIMHSVGSFVLALILGTAAFIFSAVTGNDWLLCLGIGLFGYALHVLLDIPCHRVGERWFKFFERFWMEVVAWGVLIVLAMFVNTYFAVVGMVALAVASVWITAKGR